MKHLFLLTAIGCMFTTLLLAQTPSPTPRFTIQGRVIDTASVALKGATVMLLSPADSSLVSYGVSSENGAFTMKNVKRDAYLLKISYVGFIPFNQLIKAGEQPTIELGDLKLKPITKELFEVVIRTAKAPLTIRGDTIEYNTASFKVPPGSTVEDLLRKLPGVQVDKDGNIRAQGQEVKRVTVDGKSFFGSDPKVATKNLQAEAISKVQVFTDKSEQAKLTGVDDGKKEKTVNLQLKDEFKKGGFGKVTAGGGPATGTNARGEVKANYNKFDAKQQISLIGLANNTNQQGMSFDDYQDFRGSNAFNWNDDADFGFSSGYQVVSFGDDNDESLNIPIRGDRGRGFSTNAAIGANYNYDTKKTKFSSNYYYSQTRQALDALRTRENFFTDGSLLNNETSSQLNFNGAHRASIRYQQELDSLNSLVFLNQTRLGTSNASLMSLQQVLRNTTSLSNQTSINNNQRINSFGMANTLIYSLKFRKKGRRFNASATQQVSTSDGTAEINSDNQFFQSASVDQFLRQIRQRQTTASTRSQYKASLQFIEPLSKKFYWESFYNFSQRYDRVDRDSYNRNDQNETRNDTLSRYYTNQYMFNRLGSSLRYSFRGINISAGGAVQRFSLKGRYAPDQSASTYNQINRIFTTFIPNVSINFDLKNNKYLYGSYNLGAQMPSSRDLQPVIDISNPLFISEGNPDLLPQLNHTSNLGYNYYNPVSFINLFGGLNLNSYINQIVYSQTINPQTGVTRTRPVNISGGNNYSLYGYFSFPLKKNKATLDANLNLSLGKNLTPINNILNRTRTQSINPWVSLNLTPSDRFTFFANADWTESYTRYDLNSAQNQTIRSTSYGATANAHVGGIYLTSSFNYSLYLNERFGFRQEIPIWNAAVYKILGKAKRGEIRFTANDLLNRNLGVQQFAGLNYVSQERVNTLARYFMLSFTYNMRGVSSGNLKRN